MKDETIEEFIDKDTAEREKLQRMIAKCTEFLEAHGYEVHLEGQSYCKSAQHFHKTRGVGLKY